MTGKKVVLGMSGGVDSSVAALLLQRQGYEVHGYFMNCGNRKTKKTRWPSSIDWQKEEKDVRFICRKLGIDLHVKDCEEGYEVNIIRKMFRDYSLGLTPNPDILCNNVGKFPGLLKVADKIGADFIATGHYARVRRVGSGKNNYGKKSRPVLRDGGKLKRELKEVELFVGKDKEKDQSYFLFGLSQRILSRCLFPLGEMTKTEVRKIAKRNKFPNWDKRSSRGICYLGKIDVKKFLHSRIKERKGKVFDTEGEVIGSHVGTMFFTIGERVGEGKGFVLDRAFKKKNPGKLFVAAKRKGNALVIASAGHEVLKTKKVFVKGFTLVTPGEKIPKTGLKARIRHLGKFYSGKLVQEGRPAARKLSKKSRPVARSGERAKKGRWTFIFDKGVEAVAPGQIIVIHKGERLVCGGEIRLK